MHNGQKKSRRDIHRFVDEKRSTRAFENLEVASGYYSNAEAGKILSGDCDEEMGKAKVEEKKREGRSKIEKQNEKKGGRRMKRSKRWRRVKKKRVRNKSKKEHARKKKKIEGRQRV